jgi:peptidoglycan hydrolase-like protein with peptidoglycan-binding domain
MNSELSRKTQGATVTLALLAMLAVFLALPVDAQGVTFTQNMTVGSGGAQVSALQSYLSTTAHYPEKLVTGYFGPLTQAAVQRFQCAESIVCSGTPSTTGYGQVGPLTRARLNVLVGEGIPSGGPALDRSAPIISNVDRLERRHDLLVLGSCLGRKRQREHHLACDVQN